MSILEFLVELSIDWPWFGRRSFLKILDEGPRRLEIESNRGRFVVDGRRRVVARNGKDIARFDQIKFIDIKKKRELGEPTEWSVVLYISSLRRIRLGQCRDDYLVSHVGAKLATLTGAKPLGWNERWNIPM